MAAAAFTLSPSFEVFTELTSKHSRFEPLKVTTL